MDLNAIIDVFVNYKPNGTGLVFIGLTVLAICMAIGFKIYAVVDDKKKKNKDNE